MTNDLNSQSFSNSETFKKLQEKAKAPYQLNQPGAISPERLKQYVSINNVFTLMYGTQLIDDSIFEILSNMAKEFKLVDKMIRMQNGDTVNFINGVESENRKALHSSMRSWVGDSIPHDSIEEAKLAKIECEKLEQLMKQIDDENKFTDLIHIGIGGSDLGPNAIMIALKRYAKNGRKVHFLSNVDPDNAAMVLNSIDPKKTLVVVVSKSGSTIETLTNEEFVKKAFIDAGCNVKDHFIMVTGDGSPIDKPEHYLAVFHMWDYVGGRYSSTSMVGGVSLSFAIGYDNFKALLEGANYMDVAAQQQDIKYNIPLLMAMLGIWNRNFLNYPSVAVLPYSQALSRFTAHLQQCDMESNGKMIDKDGNRVDFNTGVLIWGEAGTNGQHSFYQCLHQGTDVVPIEFIGFKESQFGLDMSVHGSLSQEKLNANLIAQVIAFAVGEDNKNPNKRFEGNRPSLLLLAKKLDPYTMGALLSLYEHKVVFQGFCWNINSFDQEGVQLGKVLANKILALKSKKSDTPVFPEAEVFLDYINTR